MCDKDKERPGIDVFSSITGFSDRDPTASSLQCSPTAFERFKRMSVSQHSAKTSKATRTAFPGKEKTGQTEKVEKPKARRSIAYSSDLKTALPGKTIDKLLLPNSVGRMARTSRPERRNSNASFCSGFKDSVLRNRDKYSWSSSAIAS